jgi:multisubunit Na+/H+ antiporter MnhF subunit
MNEWLLAAVVLVAALVVLLPLPAFLDPVDGLIALQVGGSILTAILLLLAQGTHRQPFADLALVFAVLSFVSCLAFARLLERRL